MNLQLVRFAYLVDCTLGWLTAGPLRLATIEEPWRADPDGPGGQALEAMLPASCVQDGTYRLEPHSGITKKDVWALVNKQLGVWHWPTEISAGQRWGRSAVLIHVGNSVVDIEGCIAVGLSHGFDPVERRRVVYQSQKAIEQLRAQLGTHEMHQLNIRPIAGTAEAA